MGYEHALEWVLAAEGGFCDDVDDPGGATYAGVSLRAVVGLKGHDGNLQFDLDGDGDVDADDIRMLEDHPELVASFYEERYWNSIQCNLMPWPVSLVVFDGSVNHGPAASAVLLQRALGVRADAIVGPKTLRAINRKTAKGKVNLIRRIFTRRSRLYYDLSVRRGDKFYDGWMRRLFDLAGETVRRPR
jgi:lysozyme family protein